MPKQVYGISILEMIKPFLDKQNFAQSLALDEEVSYWEILLCMSEQED